MAPTVKTLRPRNRALNETLMARSRGGGSGAHRPAEEKRGKSRRDREVAEQLREDAYARTSDFQD